MYTMYTKLLELFREHTEDIPLSLHSACLLSALQLLLSDGKVAMLAWTAASLRPKRIVVQNSMMHV